MSDFGCRCTDDCVYRQQCEGEIAKRESKSWVWHDPLPVRVAVLNRRIKNQRKQLRALNRALREWQDAARIARLEAIDRDNRLVSLLAVVRNLSGRLNKALVNLAICEGERP